jgi:hypothetical protein
MSKPQQKIIPYFHIFIYYSALLLRPLLSVDEVQTLYEKCH